MTELFPKPDERKSERLFFWRGFLSGLASFLGGVVLASVLAFGLITYTRHRSNATPPSAVQHEDAVADSFEPLQYPGGIVYFQLTGVAYFRELGRFMQERPGLRCQYAGSWENVVGVGAVGYAWVCTDIAQDAQDCTVQ